MRVHLLTLGMSPAEQASAHAAAAMFDSIGCGNSAAALREIAAASCVVCGSGSSSVIPVQVWNLSGGENAVRDRLCLDCQCRSRGARVYDESMAIVPAMRGEALRAFAVGNPFRREGRVA
jgi:hypothetical protein